MTAPVWMAFPPEVHSALLSSGPGPGPLLASAGAWSTLSTEYTEVAEELSALVAGVQAGAWQGPSSESYVAANSPYVAWLLQAAANSTAMATQQQTAATAYTTALAAMPTLPELAANHITHGVLVATNFFGINTIPIALNEADYARMWIQAATTMSMYQTVSAAAVAAAPQTTPAPQIVKADATPAAAKSAATGPPPPLPQWLSQLLNELGYTPPTKVPLPVNPNQYLPSYGDFLTSIENSITIGNGEYAITPGETLGQEVGQQLFYFYYTTTTLLPNELSAISHGNLSQIFSLNTVAALFSYVIMRIDNIGAVINYLALNPVYLTPVIPLAAAPLPAAGAAFGSFAGLANLAQQAVPIPAPAAVPPAPPLGVPITHAPVPATVPASNPASAPTPVAVSAATPSPAAGSPPPPATPGPGGFPYLVGDTRMNAPASGRAKTDEPLHRSGRKAPAIAAAAVAPTPAALRRRRRRKAQMLSRGYEYMDLDQDLDSTPDATPNGHERVGATVSSDQGVGPLGFAGTAAKDTGAQVGGLATLAHDSFGGGPTMPMVPHSWTPGSSADQGGDET
jgi:PPE-repeat protein